MALVASHAYGRIVGARNARRDRGIGVRSVEQPVISVGNIVVGGTGKSPMVRWIAQWALSRQIVPRIPRIPLIPLIAIRGYRSRNGRSDEAIEHQQIVPEARLAVGANRFETIRSCIALDPSIGVVIMDDGFQHRVLARDLDIVLIDRTDPQLDGALLPLGWLREPATSLSRAGAVVVTHATEFDAELDRKIRTLHGRSATAWCDHAWSGLEIHRHDRQHGDESRVESNEWIRGRRVAVWAGIARPDGFVRQLQASGAVVVEVASLRDHASYGHAAVARLTQTARERSAELIAMTRKDWVKVAIDAAIIDLPVVVPILGLKFSQGEDAFRELLERSVARR